MYKHKKLSVLIVLMCMTLAALSIRYSQLSVQPASVSKDTATNENHAATQSATRKGTTVQGGAARVSNYGKLPLSFEENHGQTDPQVKFLSRGHGYGLYLTSTGAMFSLTTPRNDHASFSEAESMKSAGEQAGLAMVLKGANSSAQIKGTDQLPGKVNYLLGNVAEKWQTDLPTFSKVSYEEIYPGIDLVYYGNQQQLEYDFVVGPHRNPKNIRVAFDNAARVRLNSHGDLTIKSDGTEVTLLKPRAYQKVRGKQRTIPSRYVVRAGNEVAFSVGRYNRSLPLVIDPVLVYSSYLGGSGSETGNAVAVDSTGSAYIVGQTNSPQFPVGSPLQPTLGGLTDVFITKLNPAGTAVVYSTFLGGSGSENGFGVALSTSGDLFVTGQTSSVNFPLVSPLHATFGGSADAFVAKLNNSGSALIYSTYLGGNSAEAANAIAVDSAGNAYVAGQTISLNFPTTNPIQAARSGSALFKTTNGAANWDPSDAGFSGAVITSMAFDSFNSSTIYATADTGFFRSTNGGASWIPLSTLPSTVNKLVADPVNMSILYAATNVGMFKSVDGGEHFSAINNGFVPSIARVVAIDPVDPFILYAASFGNSYFKTVDGGANWTSFFFNGSNATSIVVDPNNHTTVYAGTSSGVFKSTNSGSTWSAANNGFGFSPGIAALAFDKTNNILYAASNAGVFKSTNGASSWTPISSSVSFGSASTIAVDPSNPLTLYVASQLGPYKTVDGGITWNPISNGYPNTVINSLILDPANPSTLFIGTSLPPDVFVTKLNATGSAQLFSTYLGGPGNDLANAIAIDTNSNVYLTGWTSSDNFPTANALQPVKGPSFDAYVAKLNNTGSALVYSTFLGGDSLDLGFGIAVDAAGNAFVAGSTSSSNFPTANAFQATLASQFLDDGFVAKLNPAGSALVYSTYLGGSSLDQCLALALDSNGNAYVTGLTASFDFPLASGTPGGSIDAFVSKIAPTGASVVYAKYLGGSGNDQARGIAIDGSGNAYVTGSTSSPNFPTAQALQSTLAGPSDAFITKVSQSPDLVITMNDSPDPVVLGSDLTYQIAITNSGELAATGVTVTDNLPAGTSFVSATASQGSCTGGSVVTCNIGTLNSSTGATITLVIKPAAVLSLSNTANVAANEPDANPANNS
ncbi:MAG TPA: SBBP repeat-containing protein, partial [Pyrinomonadaceae bacterium]|nr:SBBP repeat-containing protein [Pyrinomonadaceae bacterium]